MMSVHSQLVDHRGTISERWRTLTLRSYSEDAAGPIRKVRDEFRNPIGHAVSDSLDTLVEGLLGDTPVAEMRGTLDRIVRIRAVQELSPSEAVGFVFHAKRAAREALPSGSESDPALARFDARIDELALLAFEIWASCREQLLRVQRRAVARQSSQLARLAKRLGDPASDELNALIDELKNNGGHQA